MRGWRANLLPPLHVLCGALVLYVEESMAGVGDLPVDLRVVELVAHYVMVLGVQACTTVHMYHRCTVKWSAGVHRPINRRGNVSTLSVSQALYPYPKKNVLPIEPIFRTLSSM
jgi:hypothetical protein